MTLLNVAAAAADCCGMLLLAVAAVTVAAADCCWMLLLQAAAEWS